MTDQAAVWNAFRDSVSRSLARDPERAIAHLTAEYTPALISKAKATIELAQKLTPEEPEPEPEPEVIPEEPGKPHCSWCGSTTEPLTDQYPRPPRAETIMKVKAPHGIPEPIGVSYGHEPAHVVNTGDMHCQDEEACGQRRQHRLPQWRLVRNRAAREAAGKAFEQEYQRTRWQTQGGITKGYQGHPITAEPAWLSGPLGNAASNAQVVLSGYQVVQTEVGAWVRLQHELDALEPAGDYIGLAARQTGSPLETTEVPPQPTPAWHPWSHTIAGNPQAHRSHLVGGAPGWMPGTAEAMTPVGGGQAQTYAAGPKLGVPAQREAAAAEDRPKLGKKMVKKKAKPVRRRGYARLNVAQQYAKRQGRLKPKHTGRFTRADAQDYEAGHCQARHGLEIMPGGQNPCRRNLAALR